MELISSCFKEVSAVGDGNKQIPTYSRGFSIGLGHGKELTPGGLDTGIALRDGGTYPKRGKPLFPFFP